MRVQYSYRELSTRAFEHVHSLSLDFHISKKTGEVLSALSKGAAINAFLEQVLFQIFPVAVDLALASVYFCIYFDAYFALIVLAVMTLYIFATIKITDWRTGLRRDMVTKSREEFAIKNDSISNYETVKVPSPSTKLVHFTNSSTLMRRNMNLGDIARPFKFTRQPKKRS
jgi:ATP-binding cassette, subfamily B, vacuolar membrane transporter HMT1/ACLQ